MLAVVTAFLPLVPAHAGKFTKPARDTIVFEGSIEPGDSKELRALLDDRVKLLIVNSGGGYIVESGEMAKAIEKYNLDIAVDRNCHSACANDLFMSGARKYLSGSFRIGDEMRDLSGSLCMHGGALGRNDQGVESLEVLKLYYADRFAAGQKADIGGLVVSSMEEYEQVISKARQSMKDQLESYRKKGINTDVLLAHKKTRKAWACYTKRGLESMGVRNVEGESANNNPPNSVVINGPNLPDPRREMILDPYGSIDRID